MLFFARFPFHFSSWWRRKKIKTGVANITSQLSWILILDKYLLCSSKTQIQCLYKEFLFQLLLKHSKMVFWYNFVPKNFIKFSYFSFSFFVSFQTQWIGFLMSQKLFFLFSLLINIFCPYCCFWRIASFWHSWAGSHSY